MNMDRNVDNDEKKHRGHRTYKFPVILIIISLGGLMLGVETSSMPVFVGSAYFRKYFNNPGAVAQGIIAASNPAGAFCKLIPYYVFMAQKN